MSLSSAVIIDDEPDACKLLEDMLVQIGAFKEVKVFTDADEGLKNILEKSPDAIFLDIEMPGLNGIEIIKELKPWLNSIKIVFITAFPEYGLDAAKNNAFDYLLKPVDMADLINVTEKLINSVHRNIDKTHSNKIIDRLIISSTNGVRIIKFDNILYLEADKNYTEIKLVEEERLLTSMSLGKIEKKLPDSIFLRISRKHIINFHYLSSIDFNNRKCCLMSGKSEVKLKYTRKINDLIKE